VVIEKRLYCAVKLAPTEKRMPYPSPCPIESGMLRIGQADAAEKFVLREPLG